MPEALNTLYIEVRDALRLAEIRNADVVARHLVQAVSGISDIDLIVRSEQPLPDKEIEVIRRYTARRLAGEPVSRILGTREFHGLEFEVTPAVLDPRPDTEVLVDRALDIYGRKGPDTILDLGTGSGCILISLLHEWRNAKGVAADISEDALRVARRNAEKHNVDKRIEFIHSDWDNSVQGIFDLIVSNPPYISNHEFENLPSEVKNYDPEVSLKGGHDGLDAYKRIILLIKNRLNLDGTALLEIGFSQSEKVVRLVEDSGLKVQGVHPDSGGILRVVEISFGEK